MFLSADDAGVFVHHKVGFMETAFGFVRGSVPDLSATADELGVFMSVNVVHAVFFTAMGAFHFIYFL